MTEGGPPPEPAPDPAPPPSPPSGVAAGYPSYAERPGFVPYTPPIPADPLEARKAQAQQPWTAKLLVTYWCTAGIAVFALVFALAGLVGGTVGTVFALIGFLLGAPTAAVGGLVLPLRWLKRARTTPAPHRQADPDDLAPADAQTAALWRELERKTFWYGLPGLLVPVRTAFLIAAAGYVLYLFLLLLLLLVSFAPEGG
jgi:hypothetical protein